jgi:hypothetical protein
MCSDVSDEVKTRDRKQDHHRDDYPAVTNITVFEECILAQ